MLPYFGNAGDLDAELFLRDQKIGQGLLLLWLYLQEHDVFRRVSVEDGPAEQVPVTGFIQSVEKWRQVGVEFFQVIDVPICLRKDRLEAIDRREPLNFHQFWLQTPVRLMYESEIRLQK